MSYHPGVKEAILDHGLQVVESAGWTTRGDPDFDPRGHVVHHDVIAHTETLPRMLITGRPDLSGPLCNFWLPRSGKVHLVAAGEANHAGSGGWNGLSGNASVWGVEMNNLGVASDPWPEEQIEAAAKLCKATADYSGFPVANVCFHNEWTTRKIDPHTLDPGAFRRQVALTEKGLSMADVAEIKRELREGFDRVVETLNEGRIAQTRNLRRAIWTAQGKTADEIDELEAKLGDPD